MVRGAINTPDLKCGSEDGAGGRCQSGGRQRTRKEARPSAGSRPCAAGSLSTRPPQAGPGERSFPPPRSSHGAAPHPGRPLRTCFGSILKSPGVDNQGQETGALRQGDAQDERQEKKRQFRLPRHSRRPSGAAREKSQPSRAASAGQREKGPGQLRLCKLGILFSLLCNSLNSREMRPSAGPSRNFFFFSFFKVWCCGSVLVSSVQLLVSQLVSQLVGWSAQCSSCQLISQLVGQLVSSLQLFQLVGCLVVGWLVGLLVCQLLVSQLVTQCLFVLRRCYIYTFSTLLSIPLSRHLKIE